MKISLLLSICVVACGGAQPAPHNSESWEALSNRVLDHYYKLFPGSAVGMGFHEYDGQMRDLSNAALTNQLQTLHADLEAVKAYQPMDPHEREERDTLRIGLQAKLFGLEDLDSLHRNPMAVAGDFNIDDYILRDYAPVADRAAAIVKVCGAAKEHLDQARALLKLPAPKTFVETAIMQFKGLADFVDKDVPDAMKDAPPELAPALEQCKTAFVTHAQWLEQQLPAATNDFAIGKDKLVAMLAQNDGIKIDLKSLEEMAKANLDRDYKAIEAAAHEVDPKRPVVDVVNSVFNDRPTPDTVMAEATKQLEDLRGFITQHKICTLPSNAQAIVKETPSFARYNSASLSGAGTFEKKDLPSYYYISQPDPTWPKEMQATYLPSHFNLLFTSVHEVYPGHFVNGELVKQQHSKVLATFGTYTTVEGWAHYTEEMMYDEGLTNHDPRAHIAQLTEALLRDVRFVVAIGEHAHGMSVDEATKLFATKAFQDPGNAKQQAVRGTFDPGFLSYTVGKLGIMKMRTDWKEKHPNGTLMEFHDAFLAHGIEPLPVIRRVLVGDDAVFDNRCEDGC
ncbi:MAG: DUF885 domain-containing protein [Kofleriaceae bacterium]